MADDRKDIAEQHAERRRRARDGILDALAKDGEPSPKVLLRLMLTMVEEIGDKIDAVLANEKGLRDVVLNGHADVHHEHHVWVTKKIEAEEQDAKDAAELARAGKKAAVEQAVRTIIITFTALAAGALGAVQFLK